MFRTVPLSIIRSLVLYYIHSKRYVSYRLCWLSATEIRLERPDLTSRQWA